MALALAMALALDRSRGVTRRSAESWSGLGVSEKG